MSRENTTNSPRRDEGDHFIDGEEDAHYFAKLPKIVRDCVNYSPERYGCKEIYAMISSGEFTTDQVVQHFLQLHPEIQRELDLNERVRDGQRNPNENGPDHTGYSRGADGTRIKARRLLV